MVADHDLAHKMLVEHGADFADRPPLPFALQFISRNTSSIGSASYGHLWRAFRRNIVREMLDPCRFRQFAGVRQWALQILLDELRKTAATSDSGTVSIREIFQHAMFSQLVFLLFGEKLDESVVRKIRASQKELLDFVGRLNLLASTHMVSTFLFRESYNGIHHLRRQQREIFLPLITSRQEKKETGIPGDNAVSFCYLDSLLDLQIHEEKDRKLTEDEVISLCSEFLNAAADSTSTALEWTMANVVMHPDMQEKLADEVKDVMTEDDLHNKHYLKAVVLEGLRRHPPAHLLLPRVVAKEIFVDGYTIPKGAIVNFGVKMMSLDKKTWRDPLEFRPERFLPGGEGEGLDVAGRMKIEMMPFGAGRRICPGLDLALHHLQYFVANLVKEFRWESTDEGVDLSEKPLFTVVMSKPLRARISSRGESQVQ